METKLYKGGKMENATIIRMCATVYGYRNYAQSGGTYKYKVFFYKPNERKMKLMKPEEIRDKIIGSNECIFTVEAFYKDEETRVKIDKKRSKIIDVAVVGVDLTKEEYDIYAEEERNRLKLVEKSGDIKKRKRQVDFASKVVYMTVSFGILLMAFLNHKDYKNDLIRYEKFVLTEGVVTDQSSDRDSDGHEHYEVSLEYTVDDSKRNIRIEGSGWELGRLRKGKKAKMLYNPENPQEAYLAEKMNEAGRYLPYSRITMYHVVVLYVAAAIFLAFGFAMVIPKIVLSVKNRKLKAENDLWMGKNIK